MTETGEIPQPVNTNSEVDKSQKIEQSNFRDEIGTATLFANSLMKITSEREYFRYTPITDTRMVPREYFSFLGKPPEDAKLSRDDVNKAKQAAFGISLEYATQICELRPPSSGQIREDPASLEALMSSIKKGRSLGEHIAQIDKKLLVEEARRTIARWSRKPVDQITRSDDELLSWAGQEFQNATIRLTRNIEAASNVYSRR